MFTVFDSETNKVIETITARTPDIAFRKAVKLADRCSTYLIDDTCEHGTAYDLCNPCSDPA